MPVTPKGSKPLGAEFRAVLFFEGEHFLCGMAIRVFFQPDGGGNLGRLGFEFDLRVRNAALFAGGHTWVGGFGAIMPALLRVLATKWSLRWENGQLTRLDSSGKRQKKTLIEQGRCKDVLVSCLYSIIRLHFPCYSRVADYRTAMMSR